MNENIMAPSVLFLVFPDADYINGRVQDICSGANMISLKEYPDETEQGIK